MAKIYTSTWDLIGNTPLMEVTQIEKKYNLEARLLVKLEYLNPAGSVKDRLAKAMIEDAEERGILKEGSVIINEVRRAEVGVGFDAYNEVYGNMIESGILDPVKVTKTALRNATSVASTFLTTESVVANIKEETPAMPAGGMGMM